jgi:hypothetical protein
MVNEKSPRQTVYDMFLTEILAVSEILFRMNGKLKPESIWVYVRQAIAQAKRDSLQIHPRKEVTRVTLPRFSEQKTISGFHVRVGQSWAGSARPRRWTHGSSRASITSTTRNSFMKSSSRRALRL